MEEKLFDVEQVSEEVKDVMDLVPQDGIDWKSVGKYGAIATGVVAAGFGIYKGVKFGKKKWAEHKEKTSEPKKAMSNIIPDEQESDE